MSEDRVSDTVVRGEGMSFMGKPTLDAIMYAPSARVPGWSYWIILRDSIDCSSSVS